MSEGGKGAAAQHKRRVADANSDTGFRVPETHFAAQHGRRARKAGAHHD